MPLYTLVQHSAFGRGHEPTFNRAVEECAVTTAVERRKVIEAGGLLFTSYQAASEASMATNYPADYSGFLIPKVNGSFSSKKVDGLAIYIPESGSLTQTAMEGLR